MKKAADIERHDRAACYCLVYNYAASWTPPTSCPSPGSVPTTTTGNNGNVMGYWFQDNANATSPFSHTATYTYDHLNRLTSAAASGRIAESLGYSYDRYGNVTCTGGAGGGSANGYCTILDYNTGTNRITEIGSSSAGISYNAAGDMTGDGTHTYTWDAEGRLTAVDSGSTASMAYNALGRMAQRILPSIPSGWQNVDYQYDAFGQAIGGSIPAYPEIDARLPLPGGAIAYYMYSWNTTIFAHVNALGSLTQTTTSSAGGVARRLTYYPWGQIWADTGTDHWEENFAGQEMTMNESGLNYTPNRMYSPTPGRWMSPDPLAGDITNPQSLNRYAYATNNPTTLTDPTGLDGCNVWNVSYEGSGNAPWGDDDCASQSGGPVPPSQYQASMSYDPATGGFYDPAESPGGSGNPGNYMSSNMSAAYAAYIHGVNATFDALYMEAQLQAGGISLSQVQTFITLHPDVMLAFELLSSATAWGPNSIGRYGLNQYDVYGWSVVDNPLEQAGMIAAPVASPWAPVAWYGGASVVAGAGSALASGIAYVAPAVNGPAIYVGATSAAAGYNLAGLGGGPPPGIMGWIGWVIGQISDLIP